MRIGAAAGAGAGAGAARGGLWRRRRRHAGGRVDGEVGGGVPQVDLLEGGVVQVAVRRRVGVGRRRRDVAACEREAVIRLGRRSAGPGGVLGRVSSPDAEPARHAAQHRLLPRPLRRRVALQGEVEVARRLLDELRHLEVGVHLRPTDLRHLVAQLEPAVRGARVGGHRLDPRQPGGVCCVRRHREADLVLGVVLVHHDVELAARRGRPRHREVHRAVRRAKLALNLGRLRRRRKCVL